MTTIHCSGELLDDDELRTGWWPSVIDEEEADRPALQPWQKVSVGLIADELSPPMMSGLVRRVVWLAVAAGLASVAAFGGCTAAEIQHSAAAMAFLPALRGHRDAEDTGWLAALNADPPAPVVDLALLQSSGALSVGERRPCLIARLWAWLTAAGPFDIEEGDFSRDWAQRRAGGIEA